MSDAFKAVSDSLSIVGQVTPEQLQQAAQQGFKSVLNLRSPNEPGVLSDEQQKAAAAGLEYANVPLNSSNATAEGIANALKELESLPKPVLVHCGAAQRAGGIALIATALNEGLTIEQITEKANELGLSPEQPHLRKFISEQNSND
ncbi:beta-lactamase hydrolase domain-containing protein [Egbenema bharatensis]|uniref:beta-lactamase hydrolase domain-containing protein n=1 Tax=Egbenema bharatensis TaxID=3463334 RepID=UPI003A88C644